MKNFLRSLAFVLMVGGAYAQNSLVLEVNKRRIESGLTLLNLPDCPATKTDHWNQCFGSLVYGFGGQYVGEFKDNKRSGLGVLYDANGQILRFGLWLDDQLKIETQLDTRNYPFMTQKNELVTTVTSTLPVSNLPACQGSDFRNLNNCFGTHTFPDGAKYLGEWKAMMMHGRGTFTSAIGLKYEGEWKDNKYNGQGTLLASNGSVITQGIWADGKFIRSASQLASLPSASSNNAEIDRLTAEVEAERKKRQELEVQLAATPQPRVSDFLCKRS